MTRHGRRVSRNPSRNAPGVGAVLSIVLLVLALATAATAGAPRGADGGCASRADGAPHVACALADTLSTSGIVAYADVLEAAVKAVGVDIAPRTFARWITRLGRIAAHYCREGESN